MELLDRLLARISGRVFRVLGGAARAKKPALRAGGVFQAWQGQMNDQQKTTPWRRKSPGPGGFIHPP